MQRAEDVNESGRVLVAQMDGKIALIMEKIKNLVEKVDLVNANAVTKEEFDSRVKTLEKVASVAGYVVGLVVLGVISLVLSRTIPGFKL